MTKVEEYAMLVAARKDCRLCTGLTNPAALVDGRYDTDEVGLWSRWQGNLSSRVMVVGQDWGDTRYFVEHHGAEDAQNPTNSALVKLVGSLGFTVGRPGDGDGRDILFFTNAVLCLKEGGLQGPVQSSWFHNCQSYLRRQVEIVSPDVVVGLGERAFRSVLRAFDLRAGPFRAAVEDANGTCLPNGSRVFAVYHCGVRIQNTHRPLDAQIIDWARIQTYLRMAA